MKIHSDYFYGNKVSKYGIQHGYVDYATLAKSFEGVLANDIIAKTEGIVGEWETVNDCINQDEIDTLLSKIEELEDKILESRDNEEIEEMETEIEEMESYYPEIFQYYIVSDNAVEILQAAGEIVFYNNELDLYIWGVTHFGTSWDYVLTNIKIEKEVQND